jgi:NAD(P)-dependent dehydrogenase (short-subunit alcohol dehydrogenase family)
MARAGPLFKGKSVLVTGASSGIGRAVAIAFAEQGASVTLVARNRETLTETAALARKAGGDVLLAPADVTQPQAVKAAIRKAVRKFGRIDIVVNNAGVLIPARVPEIRTGDLQAMLDVNLFGALHVMREAVHQMRTQGSGSIINMASLAGRRGFSPLGGYCATKFALIGLTEALRTELVGERIRVSLVLPGVVDTPMVTGTTKRAVARNLWPASLVMPPAWVVWAVFAAARFGLAEVAVPPGGALLEKLAALLPRTTDSVLHWAAHTLQRDARR